MSLFKDFSLRYSIEIAVEGFVLLTKLVYILGFYTGKLTFATIKWILEVLTESSILIRTQNWGKFQFLVPIVVTAGVSMRPIWKQLQQSYNYLSQSPVDFGINPQDLEYKYNFYTYH